MPPTPLRAAASGKALAFAQDAKELDLGGRILDAIVRPYAAKTAGIPLKFEYEMATGAFTYSWAVPIPGSGSGTGAGEEGAITTTTAREGGGLSVRTPPLTGHPPLLARETEIFVPAQVAQGRRLIVDGLGEGDVYTYDSARQTIFVLPAMAQTGEQPAAAGNGNGNAQVQVRKVRVRFDPPVGGQLPNDLWSDFASPVGAASVVLLALVAYFFLGHL